MTRKCFLTVAWSLGEATFNGPYDSHDIAANILVEDYLGDVDIISGVIGPLPFQEVTTHGKHWVETPETEKSIARQWAVFKARDSHVQWMAFGNDAEEFDQDPASGKMEWIGNYGGADPTAVYKQLADDDYPAPGDGFTYVAVPVGVFGPTDWMRVAGDMLTKIKD